MKSKTGHSPSIQITSDHAGEKKKFTDGYEDQSGNIWLGDAEGSLIKYDLNSGSYSVEHHFKQGFVNNIFLEDSKGALWLTLVSRETGTQLIRFQPETKIFETFDLSATNIAEDKNGAFWVGTFNQGLALINEEGKLTSFLTVKDGLPINHATGPLLDEDGYLWITSGNWLLRLDPDNESLIRMLLPDEFRGFPFTSGSPSLKSEQGNLYFENEGRVLQVKPSLFKAKTTPPPVILTDLLINNQSVPISEDSPLKQHIQITEFVTLSHEERDITFEFAALDFDTPEESIYAYKLENYDDVWIDNENRRTATYTNLSPGDYIFNVKAANSLGIWNEEGASVLISILPPWWRTWWAFCLYGVMLILGVALNYRYQRSRLIAKERLRAEREKAKAIESTNNELNRALKHLTETQDQLIHTEKMASLGQLTAGIAHEIKNPLNFVNNFSSLSHSMFEELKDWIEKKGGMDEPEVRELVETLTMNASKINEHGKRADGIIRSMLEHSRTGRGDLRAIDINKLVDEYVNLAYHGAIAREQGLEALLNRAYDQAAGKIEIYPQEIGRVLINLLDNAFYTVNEKRLSMNGQYAPQVSVSTKKTDGYIELRIQDNGEGIPKEIRDKIFDPFFTTKPTGSGTGLGLSLSHDIVVKGHGGRMAVESEEGEGATFIVALPLNEEMRE